MGTGENRSRACISPGFRARALERLCARRVRYSLLSMEFRKRPPREFLDVAQSEAGCGRSYFRATPSENSNRPRAATASRKVAGGCKRAKTHNKPAMTNTMAKRHAGSVQDKIDKVDGRGVADSRRKPGH